MVKPVEGTILTVARGVADATEAALRAKAPGAGVILIAAPFRINGASPLFSRIYWSGGAGAGGAHQLVGAPGRVHHPVHHGVERSRGVMKEQQTDHPVLIIR